MTKKISLMAYRDLILPAATNKQKVFVDFENQTLIWENNLVVINDKICETYEDQKKQVVEFFDRLKRNK